MANLNTVLSATDTNTAVDDDTLNPATAPGSGGRVIVNVTLTFDGVTFTPNDLYDALDAQWGTVASNRTQPSHNIYEFVIST